MSLGTRLADMQYRFYDRVRHREAYAVAGTEGGARGFETLRGRKHALVVTFKRSGEPVPTPVWFGLSDDGKLYFRSESRTAKVRRIRNDPRVRVAPCNVRAKPLGAAAEGRARVLPPEENEHAEAVIQSNYGVGRLMFERPAERMMDDIVYVEIEPGSGDGDPSP